MPQQLNHRLHLDLRLTSNIRTDLFQHREDKSEHTGRRPYTSYPMNQIIDLAQLTRMRLVTHKFHQCSEFILKILCSIMAGYFYRILAFPHISMSLCQLGCLDLPHLLYSLPRTSLRLILHRSVYYPSHKFRLFQLQILFALALDLCQFPAPILTSLLGSRLNHKTIASWFPASSRLSRNGYYSIFAPR